MITSPKAGVTCIACSKRVNKLYVLTKKIISKVIKHPATDAVCVKSSYRESPDFVCV